MSGDVSRLPTPLFASCSATTYNASFKEDLDNYKAAGIPGMGIWAYKVSGDLERSVELFQESGLTATFCFPQVPGIFPAPGLFPEPLDRRERLLGLQEDIRRLARFNPISVACLAGAPGDFDPAEARSWTVEAIREASFTAGEEGVQLSLEVIRPRPDGTGFARTIPEARELIADTGADNIDLMIDTWHVWDIPNTLEDIRRNGEAIGAVQVNDWKPGAQGWWDRAIPGEGEMDLVSLFQALVDAGYEGWYELEVFSDDGTFGNDVGERSLWNLDPIDLLRRSRVGFEEVWSRLEAQHG
jgi:sugar phosphate isomerase/epimerase